MAHHDYNKQALNSKLYANTTEKNSVFGYQTLANYGKNQLEHSTNSSVLPPRKDYYYGMRNHLPNAEIRGNLENVPNLYNQEITHQDILEKRVKTPIKDWKNWDPYHTSYHNKFAGCGVKFIPFKQPVEVAPRPKEYWQPHYEDKIYERRLLMGAKWNFYEHLDARDKHLAFLAKDWPSRKAPYLQQIKNYKESFHHNIQANPRGPATIR